MSQPHRTNDNQNLVSDNVKKLLKNIVQEKGVTDFDIDIQPGSRKGDNYLGVIAKAAVVGKKSGHLVTLSFIIKSAPKSEGFRSLTPIRFAYKREAYVYNVVIPEFMRFQDERDIKTPFRSVAKCLLTSLEYKDEALIMEDMCKYGFKMQNRRIPLNYEHARLVVEELARFHSFSFAIRDQKPELFAQLEPNLVRNLMEELDKEKHDKHTVIINEKARTSLDPIKDAETLKRYNAYAEAIFDDFLPLMSPEAAGKYAIIRHGDSWTNNILFGYEDEERPNKPTKLCFLDWQITCLGSPVLDLLYFIYSCTDKNLRDQHYDELLKSYHNQLREFTAELGSDIDKLFPYSVFMEHMQKFGKYGLAIATMLIHLMTSDSEEVPDMNEVFEKDESGIIEAFAFQSKNQAYYHSRIRDVILHQIERGYI